MDQNIDNLVRKLEVTKESDIVTMHDFFLDHFITYEGTTKSYIKALETLGKLGGGSITENRQSILRGGKGFNSTSALAALGATVHFVGRTDPFGLYLMNYFVKGTKADLSHVKTDGEMAMTATIEMKHNNRVFNAMFNYLGSVANFPFEALEESDLDLIKKTDYFLMTEWSLNLKGTELAAKIFEFAKSERCIKFFDPGDPSWRTQDIKQLVEKVLLQRNFDILGVNESEATWFASYFDPNILERIKHGRIETLGVECSRLLSEKLNKRVDLHTPNFTATFTPAEEIVVPTYDVPVLRVTGAGDAWQSGNCYGELAGLDNGQRLLFANAAAAYYITNPKGKHASKEDVIDFIRTHSPRYLAEETKVVFREK